jgi:hypothetical protein
MTTYPRRPQDIDHLSHSSVSTFLRCPRQWAFLYLEGVPRRTTSSLIRGTAVDRAAAHNLSQKIETHDDLPIGEVLEVAEDAFRIAVDEAGGRDEVDWEGSNQARSLDSAIELTRIHMHCHAPLIQPAAVQLRVSRELPSGREFVGFIDYVTVHDVVGDIKTGARRMGQDAADTDLQPTAYAFALGYPVEFEFARLIDTGSKRAEEVIRTRRDESHVGWYASVVGDVERAIDAGIFPANPTGWWCSAKACPAWVPCMVEHRLPHIPDFEPEE